VFHTIKEVTWTYFLGWQFIALGLLIIVTIVYFQQGIAGWLIEKFPQAFGNKAQREAKKDEPTGQLAPQPEGAE
jgi:branched-chain amino acid transport system permease protein